MYTKNYSIVYLCKYLAMYEGAPPAGLSNPLAEKRMFGGKGWEILALLSTPGGEGRRRGLK